MSLRNSREMPNSWLLGSISCFLTLSFVPVPFLLSPLQELLEGVRWAHRAWWQCSHHLGKKGSDGCGKGKSEHQNKSSFKLTQAQIEKHYLYWYLCFRLTAWGFCSVFVKLKTFKWGHIRCQCVPTGNGYGQWQWLKCSISSKDQPSSVFSNSYSLQEQSVAGHNTQWMLPSYFTSAPYFSQVLSVCYLYILRT